MWRLIWKICGTVREYESYKKNLQNLKKLHDMRKQQNCRTVYLQNGNFTFLGALISILSQKGGFG